MNWIERHAGTLGVVFFLGLWELAARFGWQNPAIMPAPSQAVWVALATIPPLTLAEHVAISLWRILAGFALGAFAGVALGIGGGLVPPGRAGKPPVRRDPASDPAAGLDPDRHRVVRPG